MDECLAIGPSIRNPCYWSVDVFVVRNSVTLLIVLLTTRAVDRDVGRFAELSPWTFCTLLRELSSRRRRPPSSLRSLSSMTDRSMIVSHANHRTLAAALRPPVLRKILDTAAHAAGSR